MRLALGVLMVLTAFGIAQSFAGLWAVWLFARRPPRRAASLPPVTILKPVCGDERLLEQAIASFCTQQYPAFQMVIGAQDAQDPALDVARRVAARFPRCDIKVAVNPLRHGANGKIANLMNMLPYAKHDLLVIADSDLHVRPDYLEQVVAALEQPGTGLVTTACGGEAAVPGLAARLGAAHISHIFLPGALLGAAVGRQDCLGGTMALRRDTLARAGGLQSLVNHLADDNVLGQRVRRLGLAVRLANTLPVVTVQERTLRDIWLHELRWGRTIGAIAPFVFTGSAAQFPLFWCLLAVLVSGGAPWAVAVFAGCWAVRAMVIGGIDAVVRPQRARPVRRTAWWLLPVRDAMSVAIVAFSFWSDEVVWRGRMLRADSGFAPPLAGAAPEQLLSDLLEPALLDAGLLGDESLAA